MTDQGIMGDDFLLSHGPEQGLSHVILEFLTSVADNEVLGAVL